MADMVIFDEYILDVLTSETKRLEIGHVPSQLYGLNEGAVIYLNLGKENVHLDPQATQRLIQALKANFPEGPRK